MNTVIVLNAAEIQSGQDRVRWAEGLISQLPETHEGRNSWLLNYGKSEESDKLRQKWEQKHRKLNWNEVTESVDPVN